MGNSNHLGGTLKFRWDRESKIQGGFLYIGGIQSFRGTPNPSAHYEFLTVKSLQSTHHLTLSLYPPSDIYRNKGVGREYFDCLYPTRFHSQLSSFRYFKVHSEIVPIFIILRWVFDLFRLRSIPCHSLLWYAEFAHLITLGILNKHCARKTKKPCVNNK